MTWNTYMLRLEIAVEFARLSWHADSLFDALQRRSHRHALWGRSAIACAGCGVSFVPLHGLRLFCSLRCRQLGPAVQRAKDRWHAKRAAARLDRRCNRICANPRCRVAFTGVRNDSAYCTHVCRVRASANRANARKRPPPLLIRVEKEPDGDAVGEAAGGGS